MNHILVYSRKKNKNLQNSIELLCKELDGLGFSVEQTHSPNLVRLFLNNYQIVHCFIESLPLTVNEILFLSFAKTIGKSSVLSVFNSKPNEHRLFNHLFTPDVLSVSQTNHLQNFREWNCTKMLLPLFPTLAKKPKSTQVLESTAYLIPLEKNLDEVFNYKTNQDIYFDARQLLSFKKSAQLRKTWTQLLHEQKVLPNWHLILSDEKIHDLIENESLQVVLASPHLSHTEFTNWLSLCLNKGHLIILNEFQATGFSQAWTSGHNCQVVSAQHWPKGLNLAAHDIENSTNKSFFKFSELSEPLLNELSRLYTKIVHQKTTLLSADSAKIKP
jgi:hypothetical protein